MWEVSERVYNAPTKNKNRRKLLVFGQKEKERNKTVVKYEGVKLCKHK